jgi:aspartyl-tRNA(Asn)/glutamyl-tRNA(Gln) amidotransferase subunit A
MTETNEPAGRTALGTIAPIAAAVREGRITAEAVLDAALARISALDGRLHSFCTIDETGARAAARAIDGRVARGAPVGALAGVPVAVKDLISTRGLRTTFGSRLYAENVPDEDDVVVERLRAAGAVIVGKTNTSEFGYGAFGHNSLFETTRNPWNLERTSGGSSAGSAAAVAAGMVPLAIGSDGGGSVRVPAALWRLWHQALLGSHSGLPRVPRRALPRHFELGVARAHRPHHRLRCGRGAGHGRARGTVTARPRVATGRGERLVHPASGALTRRPPRV